MKQLIRSLAAGLVCALMMLAADRAVQSYVFLTPFSIWPSGSIPILLQFGSSGGPLIDGSADWDASAADALTIWNQYVDRSKFTFVASAEGVGEHDGKNNSFWADSIYGKAFGANVLAVTKTWALGNTTTEADVLFNTNYCFNSYRGALRNCSSGGTLYDFHRVALHEFGHVLGLDHPNDYGQVVSAQMNSTTSDLDGLTIDDISGGQALYGSADTTPPTIAVSSPTSATVMTNAAFVNLVGTAADDVTVTSVTWANSRGGSGAAAGTTNWSATVSLQPGTNVITVTAHDGSNNTASKNVTVTYVSYDMNGDGYPDLLWRNTASGADVAWNLNGTTFISQDSLLTVTDLAWQMIATADLNLDGHPDIIWRHRTTGANAVWYMSGATVIGTASLPTVADLSWQMVGSADINQDGAPDLLWRNLVSGDNVVWYLADTTLIGAESLPTVSDLAWQLVASGDMNVDGKPDLLWRNVSTGADVIWYLNGVTLLGQGALPDVIDLAWRLVAAIDLTGNDGQPELIWRHGVTGANVVWSVSGTSVTGQASLPTVADPTWRMVGPAPPDVTSDINRDRHPDLVWRNTANGNNIVWLLNGTTLLSQASLPAVPDPNWQRVATADLNGDTYPDLVWRNSSTGNNVVWYLVGTTFVSQGTLPGVADPNWHIVATADVNEDSYPDLIWRNTSTGANIVWYLQGTTLLGQGALPPVPDQNWTIAGAADLDGDTYPDLVWRNISTGANVVWYLQGTTYISQGSLTTVPDVAWRIGLIADVNGDGHPDLVWRNSNTGNNVIWYLSGTTFLSQVALPAVPDSNWTLRQY